MATRIKTIEYAMPVLTTLIDNTLTEVPAVELYIPEFTGVVTFKKVIIEANFMEGASHVTGDYPSRRIDFSIAGAASGSHNNANIYLTSGENNCIFFAADATDHFIANWTSGVKQTLNISVLIDSTTVTTNWVNIYVTIYITYEYDDTQPIQIKTVRLPLICPSGALATSKPVSPLDTLIALDTELPEDGKAYRNMYVQVQGNFADTTNVTDTTVSMQFNNYTVYTTQAIEASRASDYWLRYIMNVQYYSASVNMGIAMETTASNDWYIWSNTARHNHLQAWMNVTYEFTASSPNRVFVSTILPQRVPSPMGSSSVYPQVGQRDFMIQESGSITTKDIAFYVFWDQVAPISGLNMRIGTGSYNAYTDIATTMGGANGAMIKNNGAYTLTRGRNKLEYYVYNTDTVDLGTNISGFWIINYTAEKPIEGYGAANKSVKWNLNSYYEGTSSLIKNINPVSPTISVTDYYITAIGTNYSYISDSTIAPAGVTLLFEKSSSEGEPEWVEAYTSFAHTDPETGLRQTWSQIENYFNRWQDDPDTNRLNIETPRRWKSALNNSCESFSYLDLIITSHNISYQVSGSITGSAGGTVNIKLHKSGSGEVVNTTSRVGDGTYSMSWYDNTEYIYVDAYEDNTHLGRSQYGLAGQ